ncbi:MAG: hypothetical protein WC341_05670 [Bacteroidales bacterium]|jgi:hypothetical protein
MRLFYVLLSASVMLISGCNFSEDAGDKTINQQLQSLNNSVSKVDSAMVLIDEMQVELDKVEESRKVGQVNDNQAETLNNRIKDNYGRRIARNSNLHPTKKLPLWASQLGLVEPQGMVLDVDYSQSTSERNVNEGYNSVVMVFQGSYDLAMNQAAAIAQKAGIPMSKDFKDAQQLAAEYGIESLKGMAYMNFEMGSTELPPYTISITVDGDGTLTLSVTDTRKLAEQMGDE